MNLKIFLLCVMLTAAEEYFIFGYSLRTVGLTDKQSTAAEHISINCRQLVLQISSQQQQNNILSLGIHFGQLALQMSSQQKQNTFPSTSDS